MRSHGIARTFMTCILLLAAVITSEGETRHWNRHRGYSPFSESQNSPLILDNTSSTPVISTASPTYPSRNIAFTFRVSDLHSHPLKRYSYHIGEGKEKSVQSPGWSIVAIGVRGDTLRFRFKPEESMAAGDGISSSRTLRLTTEYIPPKSSSNRPIARTILTNKLDAYTGWNSLRLDLDNNNSTLSGGVHSRHVILTGENPLSQVAHIGFEVAPGGRIALDHLSLESPDKQSLTSIVDTPGELARLCRQTAESQDEMEGDWVVYDRSLDESHLRSGGEYRLLAVATPGGYQLLYLDGARVCADKWKAGDRKAELRKGDIPGVWNVIWYDAEGQPLSRDIRAQYDSSTSLLTITFPYFSSQLRLYPVRK